MSTKYTQKFMDTSQDPTIAILDTVVVKIQEKVYGTTASASAITLATFATEADSGWRRGTVTNPGAYYLFFDDVYDSDNSPIYIGTDLTVPTTYIFKAVTITGTYDSKETLTTGAGKLASASFGGTPYFTDTAVEIVIVSKSDRTFHWDNIAYAANQVSFDVWASSSGIDDTATCDIIIYRA